jgi:salicylate hydroxylase
MALRVAIIGAGIGGLAAAQALRLAGIDVALHERAGELGEAGAGVQIGPNGFKVLRALGLEHALRGIATEPTARIALNWNDASERSRLTREVEFARFGAPYVTAHRADLHRVLRQGLDPRVIHLGRACIGVENREGGAVAHFADGGSVEADVIVGADGIRSVVREQLFGPDAPRFTNFMCWRCIVPIECLPERVGPGGSVPLSRTDNIAFYGPTGQVICYPIGGGSLLNIFAGRTASRWVEESWTLPSAPAEMLEAYRGWNEALLGMLRKVEHCFKWGIFDREPSEVWTRGRITLMGDAAHPTMPNLAQGANMAIEDAIVLARNLARHGDHVERALAAYVAERKPRTREITLKSRENFELTRQWPPAPAMSRSWIYEFDATKDPVA